MSAWYVIHLHGDGCLRGTLYISMVMDVSVVPYILIYLHGDGCLLYCSNASDTMATEWVDLRINEAMSVKMPAVSNIH